MLRNVQINDTGHDLLEGNIFLCSGVVPGARRFN